MDTFISASISGKEFGLHLYSAKIKQQLYHPTEVVLEFRFPDADADSVFDKAVSSWMGEPLVLTVADKVDSNISKKYQGIVISVKLQNGWLSVRALSEDYVMSEASKHKSYADKQVHDVATEVMANLSQKSVQGPDKSLKFKFFHQYDETDYEFLKRLARLDGCMFYHDGEKFIYQPKLKGTTSVKLALDNLRNVQLSCSLGNTKFHGAPYDFVKHTEPSGLGVQSGRPTLQDHPFASKLYDKAQKVFNTPSEIYNQPLPPKSEFEQHVKNQQAFDAGMQINLTGWTNHPMVAIGRSIECSDDSILKNKFVVVKMEAEFRELVYSSSFEAAGINSAIRPHQEGRGREYMGLLQPAVVIDNKDPEKLGRVQVQFLWDQDGSACGWARIVHTGAGKGGTAYGTHYIPRVSDHVLVGCEHGDPSLPVILGALYHSEHKPDFVTDNGTEEVLVTKTPHESTIRVLDKQGSEEIVVSMKNNRNLIRLELTGPKITVESVDGTILVHSKTIQIKADEKIEMTAKDIEITANNNMKTTVSQDKSTTIGKDHSLKVGGKSEEQVSMDKTVTAGTKISQKAGTEAEISAGVSVKVSATQVESSAAATNTIKGALVQIN